MADDRYQILIQIRDELRGLDKTTRGLRQTNQQARRLRELLKTGFAFGIGNNVVRQMGRLPRAFASAVQEGLKFNAMLEQQGVQFELFIGNASEANRLLKELKQFTATTPFQIGDVLASGSRLLSADFAAESVPQLLRRLGDLAAGTNSQLFELADALAQVTARGKVNIETLERFTSRGVPILQEFGRILNISQTEVFGMLGEGAFDLEDLLAAIESLTSEGGKFFKLTLRQSQTLNGRLSTLRDNFAQLFAGSTVNAFGDAKDLVEELNDFVTNPETKERLSDLLEVSRNLAAGGAQTASGTQKIMSMIGAGATIADPATGMELRRQAQERLGLGPDESPGLFEMLRQSQLALHDLGQTIERNPNFQGFGGDEPAPGLPPDRDHRPPARDLAVEMAQVQGRQTRLSVDIMRGQAAKRQEHIQALQDELAIRRELLDLALKERDNLGERATPDDRLRSEENLQEQLTAIAGLEQSLEAVSTFTGGVRTQLVSMFDDIGTLGEETGKLLTQELGGAIDFLGNSIEQSVGGPMGYILGQLGKLAATYIAQKLIMLAFDQSAKATGMALTQAQASAALAAWTPAAIASSIASYGASAAAGQAAYLGALATGSAAAQAFGLVQAAEGGLIRGPGTPKSDSIPALLSDREYVMPFPQSMEFLPLLEQMRSGSGPAVAPAASGGGSGRNTSGGRTNIAFFDSRKSAEEWAESQEGETRILDVVKHRRHELGIPG